MKSFTPPLKTNISRASAAPIQRVSQSAKSFVDNRPHAIKQRKLQEAVINKLGVAQQKKNGLFQSEFSSAPIQMVTAAEAFLAEPGNENLGVHYYTAIIGTDKNGATTGPIRKHFEGCKLREESLPTSLCHELNGEKWTQDKNDKWLDDMTKEERIIYVRHPAIEKLLDNNALEEIRDPKIINRNTGRPRKDEGTWKEVITLLDKGYRWDRYHGVMVPPLMPLRAVDDLISKHSVVHN